MEDRRGRPDNAGLAVRSYLIAHPGASIKDIMKLFGVSRATVAVRRRELMNLNLIPDVRRNSKWKLTPEQMEEQIKKKKEEIAAKNAAKHATKLLETPPAEGAKVKKGTKIKTEDLISGAELAAMADSEMFDEGDEVTRGKILKRILKFAFNPTLSEETQLNAMTLWTKFKDSTRAKELGPGTPLTQEDALTRLKKLFKAVGPELVLLALEQTFNVDKVETDEGQLPINENPTLPSPNGPPESPGSPPNL